MGKTFNKILQLKYASTSGVLRSIPRRSRLNGLTFFMEKFATPPIPANQVGSGILPTVNGEYVEVENPVTADKNYYIQSGGVTLMIPSCRQIHGLYWMLANSRYMVSFNQSGVNRTNQYLYAPVGGTFTVSIDTPL